MTLQEYFKQTYNTQGVDRTLLKERLQWTPTQRLERHEQLVVSIEQLRKTAKKKIHDPVPKNS